MHGPGTTARSANLDLRIAGATAHKAVTTPGKPKCNRVNIRAELLAGRPRSNVILATILRRSNISVPYASFDVWALKINIALLVRTPTNGVTIDNVGGLFARSCPIIGFRHRGQAMGLAIRSQSLSFSNVVIEARVLPWHQKQHAAENNETLCSK